MDLNELQTQKEQLSKHLASGIKGDEYKECLASLNKIKAEILATEALQTNNKTPILTLLSTSIDPLLQEIEQLQTDSQTLSEAAKLLYTSIADFRKRAIEAQNNLITLQSAIQIAAESSTHIEDDIDEEERVRMEKFQEAAKITNKKRAKETWKKLGWQLPKGV